MIIRDGGIKGVVIKLGRDFATIAHDENGIMTVGAGAHDMVVANYAAKHALGGFAFLSGIPGSIGGALRMNAGAYGREIKDVLIDCLVLYPDGKIKTHTTENMNLSYRQNDLPDDVIFLSARLKSYFEDSNNIQSEMHEIKQKRQESQPTKGQTGGSTFANPNAEELKACGLPQSMKAWQFVDAVGGRGLTIGGASMSEKHCNFMMNNGHATAADLENLGEEIRRRVKEKFGLNLRWEIKRIGEFEL